jgi:hypothetical protein
MTPPTTDVAAIAAIAAGIVAVIGSVASGTALIITALRRNTDKLEAMDKKTGVIAGHVNSAATAAQGREDALRRELALMREMLELKTRDAALLAQSVAHAAATAAAAPPAPPPTIVVVPHQPPRTDGGRASDFIDDKQKG